MDRASGSGVFARDPDAQLDMIELELSDDIKNFVRDGYATGWRLESSLREFPNIKPINFWFEYPIHRIDSNGDLSEMPTEGSAMANLMKSKKYTTKEQRRQSIITDFEACSINEPVSVSDIAGYLNVSDRCVRDRLSEMRDIFSVQRGFIFRKKVDENIE